ncbi:MAG: hypothetical protein U0I51_21780 [Muricomes sp.]|uniref:hypothetical protein n=1 Tax=Faecalicatena contorta TaxID=39482 RepID=UPI002EA4BC7C|nr:hypothetical protein [Muricomes sp.]
MQINPNDFLPYGFLKKITISDLGQLSPQFTYQQLKENLWRLTFFCCQEEEHLQKDWEAVLTASFTPTFHWAPHLTPQKGYVAARHVFRTPAVIFQDNCRTLAVIPDVRTTASQSVPCYLDMDAVNQTISIGLADSQVTGHILYHKASETCYPKGSIEISFYILIYQEALKNPFRPILSFFWEHFGASDFRLLTEPKRDLNVYTSHTYRWAFRNWKKVVWQEFSVNGTIVGAPAFIVTTTQSPGSPHPPHQREALSIWNQAWFCSLRSASGLYRHARRIQNSELLAYAQMTKELALTFPQTDGLFPAVAATRMEVIKEDNGPESPNMRTLGWKTLYWGNSDRNPFSQEIETSPYHILDMSFTADYMLTWYEDLEADQRLLDYALAYADRLVELQDDRGYFPGWTDSQGNRLGMLDDSPESSMSAAFLIHCFNLTKNSRYLDAALECLDAVIRDIIPEGRWEDFETYWSCSDYWSDHVGKKIPRNNMYKQCNFSMYFTSLALLEAYLCTKEPRYMDWGQRVTDEMLMTQSSYQPSTIPIPVIGGFGVMNSDAELNDARQSLFSILLLRYAHVTGDKEYLERGFAALRISFSMMYCPENPEARLQWEKAWPFFGELDYGFNMENYGHNGEITGDGIGIGEFTIYDWGNGAASEAYERLLDLFGPEFVTRKFS